jgi:hypothetical protein
MLDERARRRPHFTGTDLHTDHLHRAGLGPGSGIVLAVVHELQAEPASGTETRALRQLVRDRDFTGRLRVRRSSLDESLLIDRVPEPARRVVQHLDSSRPGVAGVVRIGLQRRAIGLRDERSQRGNRGRRRDAWHARKLRMTRRRITIRREHRVVCLLRCQEAILYRLRAPRGRGQRHDSSGDDSE